MTAVPPAAPSPVPKSRPVRGFRPSVRLSTRIAAVTAVVVAAVVLLAGVLLLGLVGRDVRAGQDGRLRDRAASALPDARTLLRVAATRPRREAAQRDRLSAAALDVGVRLAAADGTVLVSVGSQPGPGLQLPSARGQVTTVSEPGAGSWRVLAQPVTSAGAQPAGTLWVFSPTAAVRDEVDAVRRRVLLVALVAAPVGGLAAFLAAERAAGPLRLLRRRTSGLDPDDPAARASVLALERSGVLEVDELAQTLQAVLHRYDAQAARTVEALATARAFAAAASHELRTPLMSMRTNLDVLAQYPDIPAAERAELAADLLAEHARLSGALTALRALAQGDLVEADAFRPVDLAELVASAVADARRNRPDAVVEAHTPAGGVVLTGWAPGLRMALDNLLANALVHGAGPDGRPRVAVALTAVPGREAVVVVTDAGPGLSEEMRTAVFERFWRGPDSPGSGLGLTLVAQQVALHGGTAAFTDPEGGIGARVELRLPLGPLPSGQGPGAERWAWHSGPPPSGPVPRGPAPGSRAPQRFHKERS